MPRSPSGPATAYGAKAASSCWRRADVSPASRSFAQALCQSATDRAAAPSPTTADGSRAAKVLQDAVRAGIASAKESDVHPPSLSYEVGVKVIAGAVTVAPGLGGLTFGASDRPMTTPRP